MYDYECPKCKKHYHDTPNKISILAHSQCVACRALEEVERWEDDGGMLLNDSC